MTVADPSQSVATLLAAADGAPPVQRVRNYHLTDREAVPRPRDFLTAMRRTDGALCVRWAGPDGERVVRYADPGWELAERDRLRGRTATASVAADRVRELLRTNRPELVAHAEIRSIFESHGPSASKALAADGGPNADGPIRIRRRADLRADPALDRVDAAAVAAALPASPGEFVFRLPLELAAETVLAPTGDSDRVFAAERVADRETARAYYARQGRRGGWIPKAEARVYEAAGRVAPAEGRRESV